MSAVIKVENVSKIYRLGQIGSGTLTHDIQRAVARIRGKEDPMTKVDKMHLDDTTHVALNDVSFDVKNGEVLGIIGKNGAGKSTLLKILSRITSPTTGTVKMKGRVASLLEVGTGFHPELSGRENIFLNGAILGMTRKEVGRKFEEIVDFSGVSKFIDTPVKRYSSGMYVRLAFAVAAHLEPEILIIDEVLAVGDAEFQKKCLGKMKDVSVKDGRTVLFVSHNMTAIQSLCDRAIYLENGKIAFSGETNQVISQYIHKGAKNILNARWTIENAPGNEQIKLLSASLIPVNPHSDTKVIDVRSKIMLRFSFSNQIRNTVLNLSLHLYNIKGECIFNVGSPARVMNSEYIEGTCEIPANFLNDDSYYISVMIVKDTCMMLHNFEEILYFEVADFRKDASWYGKWLGAVRPTFIDFNMDGRPDITP